MKQLSAMQDDQRRHVNKLLMMKFDNSSQDRINFEIIDTLVKIENRFQEITFELNKIKNEMENKNVTETKNTTKK